MGTRISILAAAAVLAAQSDGTAPDSRLPDARLPDARRVMDQSIESNSAELAGAGALPIHGA
jgi:hypothetical protein